MDVILSDLNDNIQLILDNVEELNEVSIYDTLQAYPELFSLTDPQVVESLKQVGITNVDIAQARLRSWMKSCVDAADSPDELMEEMESWFPDEADWPDEAVELKRLIDEEGIRS